VLLDLPVAARVLGKAHRYVCDVTRDPAQHGPQGPIHFTSRDGKDLYLHGKEPNPEERGALLATYHEAFQDELHQARCDEDLLFHFECYALEGVDLETGPEICLGNLGGPDGGPQGGTFTSCLKEDLVCFQRILREQGFVVCCNEPFSGGYDVRIHGKRWYAGLEKLPVAALGLNENLWLTEPLGIFDPDKGIPVKDRLRKALQLLADTLRQDEVHL
jgi:N-formylglutamate amidohydrolase